MVTYIHWQKLEVGLTQHGSLYLQDLGQYHRPHFPQYSLCVLKVSLSAQNIAQRFTYNA